MFGIGIHVQAQSDFIGPLPTGSSMQYLLYSEPEELNVVANTRIPVQFGTSSIHLGINEGSAQWNWPGLIQPVDGTQTFLRVNLQDQAQTTLDTGGQTAPWSNTVGLPWLIETRPTGGGQGGLTPQQSLELSEIHGSTFVSSLMDNLTLIALTNGPVPGPINSVLADTCFGIIIRIANVPPELQPGTPDGDYWFETLATVRVFRGSDLWHRYPVHTSSKICALMDENIVAGLAAITASLWMLNMTVQINFRPGVTGEAFLMRLP